MEPSLSHAALGAVYCPYEAVVEPWLVPMGYAENARLHGVLLQTGNVFKKYNIISTILNISFDNFLQQPK